MACAVSFSARVAARINHHVHSTPTHSGHVFLLFSRGRVGIRFARWCYPGGGQTIKFAGSIEPDLGQPQVARTNSAVLRFACPLEAFFGQDAILGSRFHLETPPSAPICSIVYVAPATTSSYPLVYDAVGCIVHDGKFWLPMSALGQQRTLQHLRGMSALPPKADIQSRIWDVRFVPIADMSPLTRSPRPQ